MLLIKDKSITFDSVQGGSRFDITYKIIEALSHSPTEGCQGRYWGQGQQHFFSHLDSQPLHERTENVTGCGTWPLPCVSNLYHQQPAEHFHLAKLSVLQCAFLLYSHDDLTYYSFLQGRTTGKLSASPPSLGATVDHPVLALIHCPSLHAYFGYPGSENHLSRMSLNCAPNHSPIFPSPYLSSLTLMKYLSKIIIKILMITIVAFMETLSHVRHCSKCFTYMISYIFFKVQLYWGMIDI